MNKLGPGCLGDVTYRGLSAKVGQLWGVFGDSANMLDLYKLHAVQSCVLLRQSRWDKILPYWS